MDWYEWVFSGIGVAVLLFFIQRWFKSEKTQEATLTAQGAKVTGSPVASGTGNTQLVNSPTTVNLSLTTPVSAVLPKLQLEVREVCFDDVLHSVSEDWSQFTVGRYIFVRLWVVNTEAVPATVKKWELTFSSGGTNFPATLLDDFSKWHKLIKWEEPGLGFESRVIKEARKTLTQFPVHPFVQGIPSQGWLCFKTNDVPGSGHDHGEIRLCLLDSFGQENWVNAQAPLGCEGEMVNPELPWTDG